MKRLPIATGRPAPSHLPVVQALAPRLAEVHSAAEERGEDLPAYDRLPYYRVHLVRRHSPVPHGCASGGVDLRERKRRSAVRTEWRAGWGCRGCRGSGRGRRAPPRERRSAIPLFDASDDNAEVFDAAEVGGEEGRKRGEGKGAAQAGSEARAKYACIAEE